jgi:hypothetical protein
VHCRSNLSQNFAVALRHVLEQPSFKTDADNCELFIGVYDDLMVNFLTKMSPKVRDMKNDEEEHYRALETYAQYGIGAKPGAYMTRVIGGADTFIDRAAQTQL